MFEQYWNFLRHYPEFKQSTDFTPQAFEAQYEYKKSGEVLAQAATTRKSDEIWGPNCWLQFGNYSYRDPISLKALFAVLAQDQKDAGVSEFFVEVDAQDDEAIRAWFELGFGLQHVSAILRKSLPEIGVKPEVESLLLRPGISQDIPALVALEQELDLHQIASPVFSKLQPQDLAESSRDWELEFENPKLTTRVAEIEGEVIGLAYGCNAELSALHSGLLRPAYSATFAFGSVFPRFRNMGIGKLLAKEVIYSLQNQGYKYIVTDWRGTNLNSSNTWPKLGFEPTILRLHRKI